MKNLNVEQVVEQIFNEIMGSIETSHYGYFNNKIISYLKEFTFNCSVCLEYTFRPQTNEYPKEITILNAEVSNLDIECYEETISVDFPTISIELNKKFEDIIGETF